MEKSMLFLLNPKAGQQELRNRLLDVLDVFTAGGYRVTVRPTQGRGDLTRYVLEQGGNYHTVVCAGGDGTLNEAVSALMQMERRPALGYIPGGTVNDMAHTLGLSKDPVKAARDIVAGRPRPVDVGQFGALGWFSYVAGFGAFTDVSYQTPQEEKRLMGRLAYLLTGAKTLGGIKPIPMRMTVGEQVVEDEVLLGLVCSTTSVGGFRTPMDGVRLDDGLSEVIVAKNITSIQDLNALGTLLTRREFDPRFFYTFRTDKVSFSFDQPVNWTLDGEFGGTVNEVEIKNLCRAVEIIVPEGQ